MICNINKGNARLRTKRQTKRTTKLPSQVTGYVFRQKGRQPREKAQRESWPGAGRD